MSFNIFFHPKAKDFFDKLGAQFQRRIKKKISELKEFPEERGKHLKHSGFWSLRIGDYRAIYEIDREQERIIVLFIGHRKNVYDDFLKMV